MVKVKCLKCNIGLTDDNHYKYSKSTCKKCYIKKIKESDTYMSKHKNRSIMGSFSDDKLDEIYDKIHNSKSKYSHAADLYNIKAPTIRAWYLKEKQRRGD